MNWMNVLCGMSTIQYSSRSARLYLIRGSLGPLESSTQTTSRLLEPFFAGLTSVTEKKFAKFCSESLHGNSLPIDVVVFKCRKTFLMGNW